MTYLQTTKGAIAAVSAAVAGLAFIAPAHADAQYKADRAYCVSGEASEPRDLCLKEAAAAQADRQKSSHSEATRHKHKSAKKDAPSAAEKGATAP